MTDPARPDDRCRADIDSLDVPVAAPEAVTSRSRGVAKRTFAALRFRNYRLYVTSLAISFSGSWMQSVALAWLVLQLTGSGTALGSVMAVQCVPTLLLAAVGGTIADRVDKRRLIIRTQAAAGVVALTLGVITVTGIVEMWMVYLLAAAQGGVASFDNPTRQTFVMEMVGPADVSNAVTLNSVVINVARTIGPAVGGVLIAWLGVGECFIVNGLSYIAVIVAMSLVRTDELYPVARVPRTSGQVREGFRYAWHTRTLRTTLVMLVIVGTFTFEFPTTLPLLSDHTFGAGAGGLAAMTTLMGVGAVVGGLGIAATGPPTPARLVGVTAVFGFVVMALSAMPRLSLAYLVMPLVGAASIGTFSLSNATLQMHSDPGFRGRVMALFSMTMMGSTPIGGPVMGALGEHVSPRFALFVGSIAALVAAGFGWYSLGRSERQSATAVPTSDLAKT